MVKGGGFWDPIGGLFDWNQDGSLDFGEKAFAMASLHQFLDQEEDNSWRSFCEDGSEFGIDPEDYEAEEEYEQVLSDAKESVAWRDFCEDGSDLGVYPEDYETEEEYNEALEEGKRAYRFLFQDVYSEDEDDDEDCDVINADPSLISLQISVECPALDKLEEIKEEDFPNKRRYNAAYTLANEFIFYSDEKYERATKACCQFIIDNADTVTAANYLSHEGGFLYAQAIKDHFDLPVSLPDEDEYQELRFAEIICKIAKRSVALSLEVWAWSLETFLPYTQYAEYSAEELTSHVIDDHYSFPDGYSKELARYMDTHPDFMDQIVSKKSEMASDLPVLIVAALQEGLTDTALALFKLGLKQAGDSWKKINELTEGTISCCKNWEELESAEYFKLNMLPIVKAINIGMVQDEIDGWEKGLVEYIAEAERDCEQYAYTRGNAWRKTVPDGSKYGLDPCYYGSEQEYLDALHEEKYGWREWYRNEDTLGLDVNDFETQDEYQNAYDALREEKYRKEREKQEAELRLRQQQREQERLRQRQQREQACRDAMENALVDDTVYTLCGVLLPNSTRAYHYRTEDPTIQVGDEVLVPAGSKEAVGRVVSVGQYLRVAAPFSVDKVKYIIGKTEKK